MNPGEYIVLILGVILSGALIVAYKLPGHVLKLILAFSGAFLLSISSNHLIPEIFGSGIKGLGLFIILGFLIQLVLEYFSEGIEHGHIHKHGHHETGFPITMMLALSLHALLEGVALGAGHADAGHSHDSMFWGIILHNIPISMALVTLLSASGLGRGRVFIWLGLFSLMTPLGGLLADPLADHVFGDPLGLREKALAIVVGRFLHVSTTILFESTENHRFNLIKFLVILAGFAAGLL